MWGANRVAPYWCVDCKCFNIDEVDTECCDGCDAALCYDCMIEIECSFYCKKCVEEKKKKK